MRADGGTRPISLRIDDLVVEYRFHLNSPASDPTRRDIVSRMQIPQMVVKLKKEFRREPPLAFRPISRFFQPSKCRPGRLLSVRAPPRVFSAPLCFMYALVAIVLTAFAFCCFSRRNRTKRPRLLPPLQQPLPHRRRRNTSAARRIVALPTFRSPISNRWNRFSKLSCHQLKRNHSTRSECKSFTANSPTQDCSNG